VKVEIVDARSVRFTHKDLHVITRSALADRVLEVLTVEQGHVGVLYVDGAYTETLSAGRHAFWKNVAKVTLVPVDLRETMYDVAGQEIMKADKVTLRHNAVVTDRVTDALKVVSITDDARQALYREAQLALRAVIGARELDSFLTAKDGVAKELEDILRSRAAVLGFELIAVGIRDVILPGEMKTLLNRVTEAKKAAEANLIVRREETAAMRSQANTAKLLEDNPTLMRLRELEILEKVAASSKLNVVLGEKGLAERVVNLL
jgi:regulator of protease activity HflC (stomatin/prohibitin superfamily)